MARNVARRRKSLLFWHFLKSCGAEKQVLAFKQDGETVEPEMDPTT